MELAQHPATMVRTRYFGRTAYVDPATLHRQRGICQARALTAACRAPESHAIRCISNPAAHMS